MANFKLATPEAFDWDNVDAKVDTYTPEERAKLEKEYSESLSSVSENQVVNGTVVGLTKKEVVVNIGFKSDGIIGVSEFRYNPDLKLGDTVDVFVESQEDKLGQLVVSHKQARMITAWNNVNTALETQEIVTGFVKCRTKGGLIVDIFGIEAFLPGSQIDVKPIRDYDVYVGKTMEFKVVKINQEYRNVVVSHKALIEAEIEVQKKAIIEKLEEGQVLEGVVKNVTSYGVFIDLGGVDGLVHITDLSWGRINHPEEVVTLDEKVKVVILNFDLEKKKIALGIKQLEKHPWDSLDEKLNVGDKVKGKVVVLADYGAFVEIAPGIEGLVHVSEMSWSQHLRSAQDFMKVGDEIEAQILTLDREDRKMSLGIKQLSPDPWADIEAKYPKDSKHTGKVKNFTNFGVFVELEEGIDGLVHISDLSWDKKINHPSEFTKTGAEMEVQILDIDTENRRLNLGHKQLEENPWDTYATIFNVGSVHQGQVTKVEAKGSLVQLPHGVEGFAFKKQLRKEDGSDVAQDETIDFTVTEFSAENRRIVVSHTRTFEEAKAEEKAKEKAAATKGVKRVQSKVESSTLGDLDALTALKAKMDGKK